MIETVVNIMTEQQATIIINKLDSIIQLLNDLIGIFTNSDETLTSILRVSETINVYQRVFLLILGILISFYIARYMWRTHIKHWVKWAFKMPI